MIDIDEAQDVLRGMLASAGTDLASGDLPKIWSVFKDFCRTVDVRTPTDMVLFEVGIFAFSGPEQFHLHFVRQFAHPEEDEEDEPIQLDCTLLYEPVDELRRLGEWSRWSVQYPSLDEFFASVEGRPDIETVARHRPVEVTLFQGQV